MENNKKGLNKNFILMVIGQIISLFGNAILRFALPLYLLDKTGSAALFGIVSACSFIPMIILTPFGGIIADRVNKKYIMVGLDFITAILMIVFAVLMKDVNLVVLIIVTLMILYGIQGAYQPSVQASLPFLLEKEDLLKGNAIVNQVSALSNLI
ncbi:MAG: MFS transporter, partial [Clostridium sp.]|uniref:MFS transporter n=1 Tax=Clostridium sp. TaxID=1506 RepID=UPI003F2AA3FB